MRGLTSNQRWVLLYGFPVDPSKPTFELGEEEYSKIWYMHRSALMADMANAVPFTRPDAFWWVEIGFYPASICCGGEGERAALLRLQLPLTALERRIVAGKQQ